MATIDSTTTRPDPRGARVAGLVARHAGVPWLAALRRSAWAHFEAVGFPTPREEAWRSTDLGPIARTAFAPAPAARVTAAEVEKLALPGLAGPRLVFVNGRWAQELSRVDGVPVDVQAGGLATALANGAADDLQAQFARQAEPRTASLTALNTACFEDGALVRLPRGVVLGAPLQLFFIAAPGALGTEPFEFHPRVLVLAGENSEASIVEIHAGTGVYLTNGVTEIVLGAGARLAHTRIQRDALSCTHLARLHAELGRAARFTSHSVALGAGLARCEIEVGLAGEGAECALNGLYAAGGSQHTDNRTDVEHRSPHCTSNQLYKGVLGGSAHGIFNGRVLVAKGAQKTDAHQTNRNLILSDAALADTKPQLEIYADDVRCTHGATIGRLDETAIFYLQSRGIDAPAAREILTHAFARDAVAQCQPAVVREGLETWIAAAVGRLSAPGKEALA